MTTVPLHRRLARLPVLALALWPLAAAAQEAEEARIALVIGNSDYDLGLLPNPVNDARAIAAVLLESGFEVTIEEDVSGAEFSAAVDAFVDGLSDGAVGLFYYAGHAIQAEGRNYLLPVDVEPGSLESVLGASVEAAPVLARMQEAGAGFSIFLLDACRNNPYAPEGEEGRGLASMEGATGETLIGFATQAGDVAYDGGGANSPYTGALVTELDKEGRDILDVFRSVRRSVRIWTDGRQRPYISASIERQFYFRPPSGEAPVRLDLGELTLDGVRPAVERIWWAEIEGSRVPDDFRAFVTSYPESQFGDTARSLVATLETSGTAVRGLELVQFIPEDDAPLAGSLAQIATPCDVVAGDPDDPRRVTPGVRWGLVNARSALRECSAALAEDPTNPRLLHQMGRILDILNRFEEAEGFYRVAGSMDYSASLVNLGYLFNAGRGRERDYGEALRLYLRAAALGNLRARTNVGSFYERGWGVERNMAEAEAWYRLAAQNGWPNALDVLGNIYRQGPGEDGQGPERDIEEAIRLYRVAAELGSSNAMNNLGMLYIRGEAGEPDIAQGIEFLTRASELGNPYAPYNLGKLYRDGEGVPRDDAVAVELFRRSVDQDVAAARIALARMYIEGRGVERDLDEAAFLLAVATLSDEPREEEERAEAEERLQGLDLPADRIEAARSRAAAWLRGNG